MRRRWKLSTSSCANTTTYRRAMFRLPLNWVFHMYIGRSSAGYKERVRSRRLHTTPPCTHQQQTAERCGTSCRNWTLKGRVCLVLVDVHLVGWRLVSKALGCTGWGWVAGGRSHGHERLHQQHLQQWSISVGSFVVWRGKPWHIHRRTKTRTPLLYE